MLKIWGRTTSSNVQKVLWCCGELGLEYERVDLGGPFGGNQDPEYLAMNPNGLVPTVKDGDLIMWESNTICRYLCTTASWRAALSDAIPTAAPMSSAGWTGSCPASGRRWAPAVRADPHQARAARSGGDRSGAAAGRWPPGPSSRTRSKDRPYLAGEELTLAEITLGTLVYRWHAFSIERPALEKSQGLVRAHARAPGFQEIHRNPDHVTVSR